MYSNFGVTFSGLCQVSIMEIIQNGIALTRTCHKWGLDMEFLSAGARKVSHDNLLLHPDSVEWKGFAVAKLLPAWGISVSDSTNRVDD